MNASVQIGWVGLGSMGSRMAPNLVKNGYSVTGFDLDRNRVAAAASNGLKAAPSLSSLSANSDAIVSMVPNYEALLDVVRGTRESAKRTACLIDMSAVSPDVSAQAAELLDATGIAYLRAPVSGSTALAEAGTLSILVSGPERTFEAWQPLISRLGKKIAYLGPNEEARIMKLVVNIIIAAINSSLAEAFNLGRRSGLDWDAMIDVINESAVASPYLASKVTKLKERDWSPAATVDVIAKDMDLALELGRKRALSCRSPLLRARFWRLSKVEGKDNWTCPALQVFRVKGKAARKPCFLNDVHTRCGRAAKTLFGSYNESGIHRRPTVPCSSAISATLQCLRDPPSA